MIKVINTIVFSISLICFFSCDKPKKRPINNPEELKTVDTLGYYLKNTEAAKDTIFLGFRLGMSKKEYRNHIKYLRNNGKKITYEKGLGVKYAMLNTTVDLGNRYVYYTPISMKEYSSDTEEITGNARCILIPSYSKQSKLISLKIVSFEDWDDPYYGNDKWINISVRKKYRKDNYKRKAVDFALSKVFEDILKDDVEYSFPASETMFIVEAPYVFDIEYASKQMLISEAMLEIKTKEIKKEKSKETQF
jgi:hypothetical protein